MNRLSFQCFHTETQPPHGPMQPVLDHAPQAHSSMKARMIDARLLPFQRMILERPARLLLEEMT
jgi:hypothetical protein